MMSAPWPPQAGMPVGEDQREDRQARIRGGYQDARPVRGLILGRLGKFWARSA